MWASKEVDKEVPDDSETEEVDEEKPSKFFHLY